MKHPGKFTRHVLAVVIALTLPMTVSADVNYDALKKQVEQLQMQLQQVQEALKQQAAEVKEVKENSVTQAEAKALENKVNAAAEWKYPNTLIHMAGYADVGYTDSENSDGSFNLGSFSPIFHFQYKDLVMLEAELELEIEPDGATSTKLEYMTVDLFLNDSIALVAGLFLSPIGQFRQNLHPSWVNKSASAPPGFGHDGAAPTSDMGIQFRGGVLLGGIHANYAVYVGNGPELNTEWDGAEFELEGINAEGFGADGDGKKVFGGRIGILPTPGFEIGLSVVTGKATVTVVEDDSGSAPDLASEQARDYDVLGMDFAWQRNAWNVRGEYVKSEVGAASTGISASTGGEWIAWYTQGAYRFTSNKFEPVVRYTDFDSPHASKDQKQWAVGLNYLFTNNVIGKLAYEINDGQTGATTDDDRVLFQLAYGF